MGVRTWNVDGPDTHLMERSDVLAYLKIGSRALDKLIAAGLFPRGRNVTGGQRGVRWTGLDIACYIHLKDRLKAGPLKAAEMEQEDEPDEAEEG